MKKKIRNWIKRVFDLYDIDDLIIGGHCGCCGNWIDREIFVEAWAYGVCIECIENAKKTQSEYLYEHRCLICDHIWYTDFSFESCCPECKQIDDIFTAETEPCQND